MTWHEEVRIAAQKEVRWRDVNAMLGTEKDERRYGRKQDISSCN